MTTIKSKSSTFTEGWGGKVESAMGSMRTKSAGIGKNVRETIDSTVTLVQTWLTELNIKDQLLIYTGFVQAKASQFYEFILVASADQRAMISEKSAVGLEIAGAKLGDVNELLKKHDLDKVLSGSFEALGRSVIWTGDLIGELAEARWCCAKKRLRNLRDLALNASSDLLQRIQNNSN